MRTSIPTARLVTFLSILLILSACSIRGDTQQDLHAKSPIVERVLTLKGGDYPVPAILTRPAQTSSPVPAVVLLHGTASQKNEVGGLYQRLAQKLANAGYASIRIDFAGTGDSPVDYSFYNLSSATRDARLAVEFLATEVDVDEARVGVVGFSQGGLIAQRLAVQDERITALVTWSSVAGDGVDVFSAFFEAYEAEALREGFAQVQFPWREEPLKFGRQWFEEVRSQRTLSEMAQYNGKLLAIAGTADSVVPFDSSLKLVNAAASAHAAAYLVKGANHMFNVLGSSNSNGLAADQSTAEELLQTTVDWLKRNL